jgi:uncharacterized protein (TIGR03066 family)
MIQDQVGLSSRQKRSSHHQRQAAMKPTPIVGQRHAPRKRSSMPRWAVLAASLLVAAGTAWATAEFFVLNHLPSELVGKWVVEGGPQDGATFDFYRNGSMEGHINVNGREGIVKARLRVDGKVLLSTTTNPHTRQDETRVQTIKTITQSQLVLEDDRGQVLQMTRAN